MEVLKVCDDKGKVALSFVAGDTISLPIIIEVARRGKPQLRTSLKLIYDITPGPSVDETPHMFKGRTYIVRTELDSDLSNRVLVGDTISFID